MSTTSHATKPTCAVITSNTTYEGKQGLTYDAGISAESVGATGLCMHVLRIPPGGRAQVHLHESHETAICVISGRGEMWFGNDLEQQVTFEPGDLIYIPAGVPHLPLNPNATEPFVAVLARTDPNEQESVVLRPDLEDRVP